MWLITNFGFFSIVQKPSDRLLTVRARDAADLDRLRVQYLPTLGPTATGVGTDYAHRAKVGHCDLARAMGVITRDICYSNFKNEVSRCQGEERADVYHDVWDALFQLEEVAVRTAGAVPAPSEPPRRRSRGRRPLLKIARKIGRRR